MSIYSKIKVSDLVESLEVLAINHLNQMMLL